MPALMKLKAALTKLPTAERKVANFIIESPKKASLMVMNEIAEAADVSIPSVTRLARKLGYSGFLEFRVALASSLDTAGKAYDEAPLLANDSDEIFVEKLMKSGARCIPAVKALLKLDGLHLLKDGTVEDVQKQIDALRKDPETAFLFEEEKESFKGVVLGEGMDALDEGPAKMNYAELCAYLEEHPEARL